MPAGDFVGTTFYGCQIRSVLGQGAKGIVYKAHQIALDRPVAIKILATDTGVEAIKTITAEARALAKINHPNVCSVYEVGIEADKPFILMEYLEGETLDTRTKRAGKLPPEAILKLSSEILDALAAAHRVKVIHRDLKPSNVFLRPSQVLKLIDFGLAYLGATNTSETGGTPDYMAPEQWKFKAVDGRTDLYALGIIMFKMMTGAGPFRAKTMQDMMKAHLEKPIPILKTHSLRLAQLAAIIEKATQKSPDARYATAAAMKLDVEAMRAGQAPAAASEYGNIVCTWCETEGKPNITSCPSCNHDMASAQVKMEDLLPDEPVPEKKVNFPKGIRKSGRRR